MTEDIDRVLDQICKDIRIDRVLEQICKDIKSGDMTAIEELLKAVPEENLKGYLSEEDQ